jgi:hypothetical protein
MLSQQVANSDILSLLGASSKGSGIKGDVSENGLGEFAQLLKGQDEGDITQLMSRLSSPQAQEVLQSLAFDGQSFVTAEGQTLSPEALVEKVTQLLNGEGNQLTSQNLKGDASSLEALKESKITDAKNLNSNFTDRGRFPQTAANRINGAKLTGPKNKSFDVQSGEDFLAQRRAMFGKSHIDAESGVPQIKRAAHPSVNQYRKESFVTDRRMIRAEGMEPQVESKSDFHMTEVFEGQGENQLEVQNLQMSKSSDGSEMKMASKNQVLDLSQISASNKTELINKISGYIEQSYISGQDSVEMVVRHEELGNFKVSATRTGVGQQIDLKINTMTEKGHQFFMENESELIKSLTRNGVKISDIKVMNGTEFSLAENRSQMSDNSSSQRQGQGRGEYQSQGQNFSDSASDGSRQERRRQLWKNAREQFMNYQAA